MPRSNTSFAADDCGLNYDHDLGPEDGAGTSECRTCGAFVNVS